MCDINTLRASYPWPHERPDLEPVTHGWLGDWTKSRLTQYLPTNASVIVECGSWLGKSARFLLDAAPNATVICIDTWEGSPEHQSGNGHDDWAAMLATLHSQFIANMWGWRSRVIPVRADSFDGLEIVKAYDITPSLIYLDSEHTEHRVGGELRRCDKFWPQVPIVLDDCNWGAVNRGCRAFIESSGRTLDETDPRSFVVLPR